MASPRYLSFYGFVLWSISSRSHHRGCCLLIFSYHCRVFWVDADWRRLGECEQRVWCCYWGNLCCFDWLLPCQPLAKWSCHGRHLLSHCLQSPQLWARRWWQELLLYFDSDFSSWISSVTVCKISLLPALDASFCLLVILKPFMR